MSPVAVSLSPATAILTGGQSQQFTATVTNTGNTAVTWSLSPSVGTISASGLYTAPTSISSQQSVTVTATSAADNTKSVSATVTLYPPVAVSSIQFVQSAYNDSQDSTSPSQSFSADNTPGNFIVAAIQIDSNIQGVVSVSDSRGNIYRRAQTGFFYQAELEIWYAMNIGSGPNTVTATLSGSTGRIIIAEYSGILLANAFDVGSGSGGNPSSNPATSGGAATAVNNELIVGFVSTNDSSGWSAGSGFTMRQSGAIFFEDALASSAGSNAAIFTNANNGNYACVMAAFKPTGQ